MTLLGLVAPAADKSSFAMSKINELERAGATRLAENTLVLLGSSELDRQMAGFPPTKHP
jgi:hypothetical protein